MSMEPVWTKPEHGVHPDAIVVDDEFRFRFRRGLDRAHVKALRGALARRCKLPPVTLWRPQERNVYVLLDGAHRLEAWKQAKMLRRGNVPARIVECSKAQAKLIALQANTKDALPLSSTERSAAAWVLSGAHGAELTQAEIAKAAGVSERTAWSMAQAVKFYRDKGWPLPMRWQDAADRKPPEVEQDGRLTDDEKLKLEAERYAAHIQAVAENADKMRKAMGRAIKDDDLIFDVLGLVFGQYRLRCAVDHLYGEEDEFMDEDEWELEPETTVDGRDKVPIPF